MLKSFFFLICLTMTTALHIIKMASEVTVLDADLPRNQHLNLQGVKKISKGVVEHVILKNCSGVIDEATFKHFSKLSKITIWRSNIEEISTALPISRLIVMGSHFPNLDADLQQKLPKLQGAMFLGNKDFHVGPLILKNFKHLQGLHISEANFTADCVTKEWFKGMDYMQELGLSDNRISCIAEDAFNSLKSLRKLDLTYNYIPDLDKKTFKKLTKLEKLGLYENNIQSFDLGMLGSQKSHLEVLGVSWHVLKDNGVSAEDVLKAFPQLKSISFGHLDMPNDFKAGEFCQILRQNGIACEIDSIFGVSRILGYAMLGSAPC